MTRLEKCKIAYQKGYRYNKENGIVYGLKGNEIKRRCQGYVYINFSYLGKEYSLYGHQFAWFCVYNEVVEEIDHIDRIRDNNLISNLRSVTHKENCLNSGFYFGACYDKSRLKWISYAKIDGVMKNLGRFNCFGKAFLVSKTFKNRNYKYKQND